MAGGPVGHHRHNSGHVAGHRGGRLSTGWPMDMPSNRPSDKTQFGKGDIRGVIAPESANNAKEGGALIPTMIFGIPGSASTAVFMGGLVLLGLQPGLSMVMMEPDMIYVVIWGLAMANIVGAGLCMGLARPIAGLTRVPFNYIAPVLLCLLVLAGYQTTRSWGDLYTLLIFGLLGWALMRYGFSRPAFVIGFVLSEGIENNLYATLDFYGWEVFQRPALSGSCWRCAQSRSSSAIGRRVV